MYLERKEDLSIVYWLKDKFSATPGINIVDSYPQGDLVIPTISVESDLLEYIDFELGERTGTRVRTWYIDIFATNKSQRDDFAYKILNDLKDGILVYDYDLGFPNSTVIGHLNIIKRRVKVVRIDASLVSKMYYRTTITILAQNDLL